MEVAEAPLGLEPVVEIAVMFTLCAGIVTGNGVLIGALSRSAAPLDAYVVSVAVADLAAGLTLVPMAGYSGLSGWMPGDTGCRVAGYLALTLAAVSAYTFMWIAVDRYLAVRKPLRYETIQTRTRVRCWIFFTWITSGVLCSPPLLGASKGAYDPDARVCMLDLGGTLPYSLTLAALVLAPSLVTAIYAYIYIFAVSQETSAEEHLVDQGACLAAFLLFWGTWLPWVLLRLSEIIGTSPASHAARFWLLWLGVSSCASKVVAYVGLSPRIRSHVLLAFSCFRTKNAHHHLIV